MHEVWIQRAMMIRIHKKQNKTKRKNKKQKVLLYIIKTFFYIEKKLITSECNRYAARRSECHNIKVKSKKKKLQSIFLNSTLAAKQKFKIKIVAYMLFSAIQCIYRFFLLFFFYRNVQWYQIRIIIFEMNEIKTIMKKMFKISSPINILTFCTKKMLFLIINNSTCNNIIKKCQTFT